MRSTRTKKAVTVVGAVALLATVFTGAEIGEAIAADMTCGQLGAHAIHTQGSPVYGALPCDTCHAQVCSSTPGPNVVFGGVAISGGATPMWDDINGTCSTVYCHGTSTLPVAWTHVDPTVVRPPEVECAFCHSYPPALPHPQMTGCNVCHSTTALPNGSIDLAGGKHINGALDFSPEFSGGGSFDHTATPGSGQIALFPNNGHDDAGWEGPLPYFGVHVDCTLCHTTDLIRVHGSACATCHPTPRSTLGTWEKGCQQGGCHQTYHDDTFRAHSTFEDTVNGGNDCYRCHGWAVTQEKCLNCHAASGSAYTNAPVTTADVLPSYIGPAKINFSITVNGKVAVGRTFYRLDGSDPLAAGKSLFVNVPGSHTLEFWSLDQFGNAEATHRSASFTILPDTAPPVTTSDANAAYWQGARITLSASDNSTLGVKSTYYSLDGGEPQEGTDIEIPSSNGTVAYTLSFWSEDWSENVEAPNTVDFTVTGGAGTIRLIWGNSEVSGSPCSADPEANAYWDLRRDSWSGPVVASGWGSCPDWSGVNDYVFPVGTTIYATVINWWYSQYGYYDQTVFLNVSITTPGEIVRLNY